MPNVGDGTGQGAGPPEEQALTSNQSKRPEKVPAPLGSGEGGIGPQLDTHGNRTSPIRSGGGKK